MKERAFGVWHWFEELRKNLQTFLAILILTLLIYCCLYLNDIIIAQ